MVKVLFPQWRYISFAVKPGVFSGAQMVRQDQADLSTLPVTNEQSVKVILLINYIFCDLTSFIQRLLE